MSQQQQTASTNLPKRPRLYRNWLRNDVPVAKSTLRYWQSKDVGPACSQLEVDCEEDKGRQPEESDIEASHSFIKHKPVT